MIEEKGKVGRPIQMVHELKYHEHLVLSPEEDNALADYAVKMHMTKSQVVAMLIRASLFRQTQEIDLSKLEEQKATHDKKSAELSARIITLRNQIRQQQEINDAILRTNMFLVTSFRMLYNISKSSGQITMYPEAIEKVFGITFNVKKCNENFEDLESMPDDEMISLLEIKKIKGHAKKEEEILRKIGGI